MARTPDPKRHALWHDRIRRQATSGFTVAQFCAEERISRSKFYAWRYRLRLRDGANHQSTLPRPQTFLPVKVRVLKRGADEPLPIEADLPNGIRLRVPTADLQLACQLISALTRAKTESGGSQ